MNEGILGTSPRVLARPKRDSFTKVKTMAKKAGNRRKSARESEVVISQKDLEAIAQGLGTSLKARTASRKEAWSIFRDAFNAVLPDLLPNDMPAAPASSNASPAPEPTPDPQGRKPKRTRGTSKRRK
jgi:hypothetical protein